MRKEFSHRSPSPPAEDSEPEMTEEEKEFQLVCAFTIVFKFLLHVAYKVCFSEAPFIHSFIFDIFLDDHHKNPAH